MNDTRRFPADVYDVILSVLQIGIIAELLLVRTLWAESLAGALLILFIAHWRRKGSKLWWTLVALGTAVAISSLIFVFHR